MVVHELALPAGRVADTLAAWLEAPAEPVPVRDAATVVFVRDRDGAAGGIEVFMLKRVASMAFAPSTYVFPGGGVDPRDGSPDLPWAGPQPQEWAQRFGTTPQVARMLVATAVREVFEECGVLLAATGPDADLVDTADARWAAHRAALVGHATALHDVLLAEGLVLRSDLLTYKAFWTTPVFEQRRYATRFFAAALPPGKEPDGLTTEAELTGWFEPRALLEQFRAGEVAMLPPTWHTLSTIAEASDARAALAEVEQVSEIMPTPVQTPDGPRLRVDLP